MATAAISSTFYEDFLPNEEQSLFLGILHHDSRGGRVIRMEKDGTNTPVHTASRNPMDLLCTCCDRDTYISLNSFRSKKRVNQNVFNYENIAVDLDMHLGGDVDNLLNHLMEKINSGALPTPTMITFTGRGLCVFYTLKNSLLQGKGVDLLEITKDRLFRAYEIELASLRCTVDKSVADAARVIRMPGTVNQKNGEFCRLLGIFKDGDDVHFVSVRDLANALDFEKKEKENDKRSDRKTTTEADEKRKASCLMSRLQKLNKLIDMRNADNVDLGYRENLLFIAYSTAKPLFGRDEARAYVRNLNQRFKKPLKQMEVEGIFNPTDRVINTKGTKGYYVFSDERILDKLLITEKENAVLGFTSEGKALLRAAAKEETRAKRELRNNTIIDLLNEGYSYDETAERVDCSVSTVRRVAAAHKDEICVVSFNVPVREKTEDEVKREEAIVDLFMEGTPYKEIAFLVGCSLRTVKRVLKSNELRRNENRVETVETVDVVAEEESESISKGSRIFSKIAYVGVVNFINNIINKNIIAIDTHNYNTAITIDDCNYNTTITIDDCNYNTYSNSRDCNYNTYSNSRGYNYNTHSNSRDYNYNIHSNSRDYNYNTHSNSRDYNYNTHSNNNRDGFSIFATYVYKRNKGDRREVVVSKDRRNRSVVIINHLDSGEEVIPHVRFKKWIVKGPPE